MSGNVEMTTVSHKGDHILWFRSKYRDKNLVEFYCHQLWLKTETDDILKDKFMLDSHK